LRIRPINSSAGQRSLVMSPVFACNVRYIADISCMCLQLSRTIMVAVIMGC